MRHADAQSETHNRELDADAPQWWEPARRTKAGKGGPKRGPRPDPERATRPHTVSLRPAVWRFLSQYSEESPTRAAELAIDRLRKYEPRGPEGGRERGEGGRWAGEGDGPKRPRTVSGARSALRAAERKAEGLRQLVAELEREGSDRAAR